MHIIKVMLFKLFYMIKVFTDLHHQLIGWTKNVYVKQLHNFIEYFWKTLLLERSIGIQLYLNVFSLKQQSLSVKCQYFKYFV